MTPTDADDVRRGFLRRVENSFLGKILRRGFRLVFFEWKRSRGRCEGGKIIFITQTRERKFFYIATYMICRLVVYCLSRSTRTKERGWEGNSWMNHPRGWWWNFIVIFSGYTHDGGGWRLVCCVCLWIICWIMWFPKLRRPSLPAHGDSWGGGEYINKWGLSLGKFSW